MMESTCPFCDRLLVEFHKVVELCCSEQDIETVNGMNICVNCGLVHGYNYVTEYFVSFETSISFYQFPMKLPTDLLSFIIPAKYVISKSKLS